MSIKDLFADDDFEFPEISDREMACERLRFNTTEDILLAMQDSGTSKAELAKKLGKSKSYISQVLDGSRNMTLNTLSDIAYALNAEISVIVYRNGVDVSHQVAPSRSWSKNIDVLEPIAERKFSFTIDAPEPKKASYGFR
ncbi:hypothetical protein ABW09_11985 [Pluralibacter gergoviae]|uniref:helix-turn-helix domain-containing protein n=1 Tax=Pluralibacter gergoviae TaxID=61647 RepID=UPI000652430E|nr:helix-turn-helix transcriptional regulator [Pluralibacter gergoviae]KMK17760.1 hypothetical protein ABW09_11985 [Pluralibacter gergoviae]